MRRQHQYRNENLRRLVDHYYESVLRRNPLAATWLGEHQYDGLLPEAGAEAVDKEVAFLREMRDRFTAIGERELSVDEHLDRRLALYMFQKELFMQEDVRRWRLGRDLAMDIGDSLFMLYARDFAPLSHRVESMISRMKAAPIYLQSGRTLFQAVPQVWGEIYLESAERLPNLLDTIEKGIKGRIISPLHHQFTSAARELKKSLEQYVTWLKNAIMPNAHGDWALGTGAFQSLLALRQLGMTAGEILEIGQSHLKQSRAKLETLAKKLSGGGTVKETCGKIRNKAPASFERALEVYQDAIKRGRAFVELSGFATLPGEETLEVLETPSYMTHLIPLAAYIAPERTARPQKGLYLVTRPESKSDLNQHCYADISNVSVHEGYPGHHLQLSCQNLHPSKMRGLSESIELIEGWAHYCEEEVKSMGFENSDENIFIQVMDEVLRAARVLIDVNINQKSWTFDQALEYLVTATHMEKPAAIAEMRRYTQSPGYQLSYLIGKYQLFQLKEDLKRRFTSDFHGRHFHDLVMYEGSIPIALAREFYPEILKETFRHSQAAPLQHSQNA